MNWKRRPSLRMSRAFDPGVERIVRRSSGRSAGPTEEFTATIQSPFDERCASFVTSMVDGWDERTEEWPYAWKVKRKGRLAGPRFILISFFVCVDVRRGRSSTAALQRDRERMVQGLVREGL